MIVSLYGVFPPNVGGVSVHIKRLAERLLSDSLLGKVYVNNIGLNKMEYLNYCIDVSLKKRTSILKRVYWLRSAMWNDPCDIFHLHSSLFWDYIIVLLLVRRYGRKVCFSVHDQMQLDKCKFSILVMKYLYKVIPSDKIRFIAINSLIKKQLIKIGISPELIKVIPAFIIDFDCKSSRRICDEGRQVKILLYAPAIKTLSDVRIYGLLDGLNACSFILHKKKFSIQLCVCAPNGINLHLYDKLLESTSLSPIECELFDKPICNMLAFLNNIDIYVRPTITDGDSVLVREAITQGCVVLASDVVKRPRGTFLFHTSNVDDLCIQLEYILSNLTSLKESIVENSNDFYDDVISVYRDLL